MENNKIYLAGPLFSEADRAQRKLEAARLRELGYEVYNPVEFNLENGEIPTIQEVFDKDIRELMNSNIVIADIVGEDPGTIAEIGIAKSAASTKLVIAVESDFRPVYNKFVIGMLEDEWFGNNSKLVKSFDEAIDVLNEYRSAKPL